MYQDFLDERQKYRQYRNKKQPVNITNIPAARVAVDSSITDSRNIKNSVNNDRIKLLFIIC